jgi:nanoRNase/pAp phosphatase (c-di-AMP/oligoRNAs hydrolase)
MKKMSFLKPSFFEGKKALFLTHAGTDVDSIASAGALFFSLKKNSKISIGIIDHINLSAKHFAQKQKIPFTTNPSFSDHDLICAFDFNDLEMAGTKKQELKNFKGKIIVFDHHKKTKNPIKANNSLINEKAVSTTEIIFNWLKKNRVKINQKTAECIACGIITDSAGFHVADSNTFKIMAEVFEKGKKTFTELIELISVKKDESETIARLKAAKRVKIFKSFENIIAFSSVNSFESSSASALVSLGAKVAFVGGIQKQNFLISARVKNSLIKKTGFDLVKHVFEPLEKKFSGHGGGHKGAAAFNGNAKELEPALKECIKLTHEFFENKNKKKKPLKEY